MKRVYTSLCLVLLLYGAANAQNSLLKDPITQKPFSQGNVDNIEIIANDQDVALVAFNSSTKTFYVFDLQDNSAEDAAKNEVSSIPNFTNVLQSAAGQNIIVLKDVQVNPISKAIYALVFGEMGQSYIVKVEENGLKAEVLKLGQLPHSKIYWGGPDDLIVQDMAWGNGTLYISSGSNFSLDGEIAWVKAPITHKSTTTNRATSMFKTNWGGSYYTNAPLEKLDFGTIDNEDRLMGVTLCAPGFSVKTESLEGNGVLEITEDFNVRFNMPTKVVYQGGGNEHWLYNLHAGKTLMRIGKKYIDGSPVSENKYNDNTVHLREPNGSPTTGLSENEIKVYPGTYEMIAKWSNGTLLVLQEDEVSLLKTVTNVSTLEAPKKNTVAIYPNPSSGDLTLNFQHQDRAQWLKVIGMDGKEAFSQQVTGTKTTIHLEGIPKGIYMVQVFNHQNLNIYSEKITITQ